MAENKQKIRVSKKRKILTAVLSSTLAVTTAVGIGVGVGIGVSLSKKNKGPKELLVQFKGEGEGITHVYSAITGDLVEVKNLQVNDQICFPMPKTTTKGEGAEKTYFVGWATESTAAIPTYFVGENIITVKSTAQSFYPVYMGATLDALGVDDPDAAELTVHCNGANVNEAGIVVIPSELNSKRLVGVSAVDITDEEGFNFANIKRVIVAEGIKTIGDNAFEGCTALESVIFSDNSYAYSGPVAVATGEPAASCEIEAIGSCAFKGCTELKSIYIPAGVTEIKTETFNGCTKLASVEFESKTALTRIGYMAFERTAVEEMDFSEFTNLTVIAAKGFEHCTSLTTFKMPNTVTNVGQWAFNGCTSLVNINLSTAIIGSVGDVDGEVSNDGKLIAVFGSCSSLESINIPAGVTSLTTKMFMNCVNLTTVTFADPSAITELGSYAFQYCKKINNLPEFTNLTRLGTGVFQGCESLSSFVLPENSITGKDQWGWGDVANCISPWAFAGCLALEEIVIPNTIRTIGISAFAFSGVKNVVIPEGITTIDYRAFHAMPKLQTLTFNCVNLSTVGGDTFQPYYTSEPYNDIDRDGVYDEGEVFTDVNGDGVYTDESPIPSQLTKITIGANVERLNFSSVGIWSNAVAGHNNLTTIEFLGTTPPTISNWPDFSSVTSVIVPKGADTTATETIVNAYKTAFAAYNTRISAKQ